MKRADDGRLIQGQGHLSLGIHRQSGEFDKLDAPQLYIGPTSPRSALPLFFFNGERVERLASKDAYDQVEGGIKTLLNVEIFERSVLHLEGGVSKDLSRQLARFGDADLKEAVAEKENLEDRVEGVKEQLAVARNNVARCEEEIEKIEQQQHSVVPTQRTG